MAYSLDMKSLVVHSFMTNEYGRQHHKLDDETVYGRMVQSGDMHAVDRMLEAVKYPSEGTLSTDPLTNTKYFYITAVTITIRFCIAGGMDQERAFYTSDLFIKSLEKCNNIESVLNLTRDMVTYYVKHMASLHNTAHCSKTVYNCIDYVNEHMHEHISPSDLSGFVGMNSDYLSKLFKKELGMNITEYITHKKMDTASNMLLYSNLSCSDVALYLGFNSQSYFTKVFKKYFKMTPLAYREHAHQLPFHPTVGYKSEEY